MTYFKSWEEFEKAAERLYLQDPIKAGNKKIIYRVGREGVLKHAQDSWSKRHLTVSRTRRNTAGDTHLLFYDSYCARYTIKYVHSKGVLSLKMTDDVVCVQYTTEILQDLKKMDKFLNNLMRHMASKEH